MDGQARVLDAPAQQMRSRCRRAVLEWAVAVHPDADAYPHLLGLRYAEIRDRERALAAFRRAREPNPSHPPARAMVDRVA